jgi:ABC-2 type transport system ATP-binding protein
MMVAMRTSAIAVSGLRKAYGDKTVLDGIDLDVRAGTVFSLLGPNGAGKTTTVNVLTTLVKADGGTARVAGHDVATESKAVRAVIGVTGQFAAVDELLTGEENLQLMADLHHLRADEGKRVVTSLLDRFDLVESAQKMAATYSGGMRRKLDLAMTLVARPQIIFLDEPTAGLDPRSRRTMWNIVRELVADGVTVSSLPSISKKPISSPTGSRCSTRATWLPRALPSGAGAWRCPAARAWASVIWASTATI